jgi:serine/threonine protein kinase
MLGRGAAGVVYKSQDTVSSCTVAIKQISVGKMNKKKVAELAVRPLALQTIIFPPERSQNYDTISTFEPRSSTRFYPRKEKFILCNRVKNYRFSHFFLTIFRFMPHGSLSKTSRQIGTFPEDMLAVYIYDALKGLAYLHSHKIIHRDIKGNHFLSPPNPRGQPPTSRRYARMYRRFRYRNISGPQQ